MSFTPNLLDYPRLSALLAWLLGEGPVLADSRMLDRARARADESGIRALVELYLRQCGLDADPAPMQQLQRTRFALMRHHLRELRAGLDVPFVLLKGEPLGRRLYGSASLRSSADIDLLVRPEAVTDAIAGSRELGFDPELDGPPELFENNQFPLVHRHTGMLLELHWSLDIPRVPTPRLDECFEHASTPDAQLEVPSFDDSFRLLQASYHLYHHAGFLKGMVDLCALLDVLEDDAVAEARTIAARIGAAGLVDWALATAWLLSPFESRRWSRPSALVLAVGWLRGAHGVLDRPTPISGGGLLGWKAAEDERAPRAGWGIVMASLLDRPSDQFTAVARTIFKDRRTLAREIGRPPTLLDLGLHAASRPVELIRKAALDRLEGA